MACPAIFGGVGGGGVVVASRGRGGGSGGRDSGSGDVERQRGKRCTSNSIYELADSVPPCTTAKPKSAINGKSLVI